MQQDAHEFLNYLLNTIADLLQEERKQDKTNGRLANGSLDSQNHNSNAPPPSTWVHEIFQGTLTNETRCLNCEAVSGGRSKMEAVNGEMNGPESSNGCRAVLVSRHYCNGKGRFKMETVIGL